ncbi:hypothetical protein EMGBS15_16110 [Filimonas sp.]|nr:hypothetical protein EMGBS15_16110 [Filimonas sp.]
MRIRSKIGIVLLSGLLLTVFSFTDQPSSARKYEYTSYLACSSMETSTLPKKSFDSLIALPLCAKDSNKNSVQVQSFDVIYAERGLYQDSAGLPIIFTDYSTFQCEGNSVPKNVVSLFNERSYKGDTVSIENVKVKGPDNKSHICKGIKVIIK